jgi:hypothetical protein
LGVEDADEEDALASLPLRSFGYGWNFVSRGGHSLAGLVLCIDSGEVLVGYPIIENSIGMEGIAIGGPCVLLRRGYRCRWCEPQVVVMAMALP